MRQELIFGPMGAGLPHLRSPLDHAFSSHSSGPGRVGPGKGLQVRRIRRSAGARLDTEPELHELA